MAIADTLRDYLDNHSVAYEVVRHPRSGSSMETAEFAHIPGGRLAKALVLKDTEGYLMVVIPAVHHVELGTLHKSLGRELRFVPETELAELFPDCAVGAVPALGPAYGLETVWDSALIHEAEIYFEGGDHETAVKLTSDQFRRLMTGERQGRFSHHF